MHTLIAYFRSRRNTSPSREFGGRRRGIV
jgi:hypothetical protein